MDQDLMRENERLRRELNHCDDRLLNLNGRLVLARAGATRLAWALGVSVVLHAATVVTNVLIGCPS